MRLAIANEPTTAIAHTGRGTTLPAGAYPVAELDGAADRGETYVTGPDGLLVQVNTSDSAITVIGIQPAVVDALKFARDDVIDQRASISVVDELITCRLARYDDDGELIVQQAGWDLLKILEATS